MKYPRIPLFVISAVLATGGFGCFDIKCDEGGKCGGDCLSAGQIPLAGCPYRPCCAGSMINPVTDICESCASKGNRPGTGQDCCTGLQVNATTGLCDICFKLTADCVEGGLPACCEGSLPSAGAYCNILSRCARCSHAGGGCEADADCCPNDDPALICKDRLCQKICASDKECTDTANPICIRGECVPAACSADADCQGLKCCSGDCKADCGYGAADACVITSTGGVVAVGKTVSLKAVGIKGDVWKDGMIVPGTTCLWASSVPSVATVDADGVLTGVAAGKTEIRVRTGNGDFTNPITYTVLAPVTGSVNVYVYDESTGDPVEGAQVKVGAANFMATDANGVSGFDTAANDGTVHVMKDGYTWVSYLGSVNPGYIIFLHKSSSDTAGGFRGKFDYSPIKKDDQLHAGIAAMSISGESLFSMNMNSFFGEMLRTPMNISNPVTVKQCVPVPGGLTGGSNYLKVPDLIPEFRILGDTGHEHKRHGSHFQSHKPFHFGFRDRSHPPAPQAAAACVQHEPRRAERACCLPCSEDQDPRNNLPGRQGCPPGRQRHDGRLRHLQADNAESRHKDDRGQRVDRGRTSTSWRHLPERSYCRWRRRTPRDGPCPAGDHHGGARRLEQGLHYLLAPG
jgi:hypothetical protein